MTKETKQAQGPEPLDLLGEFSHLVGGLSQADRALLLAELKSAHPAS